MAEAIWQGCYTEPTETVHGAGRGDVIVRMISEISMCGTNSRMSQADNGAFLPP